MPVPGVIETMQDLATLPVKKVGNTIVTFDDVATIRRTFKDPTSFARLRGEKAIALEVSKRSGANIIETIADVRNLVELARTQWPDTIKVDYLQDKSGEIKSMLGDLENNVLTAIILVGALVIDLLFLPAFLLWLDTDRTANTHS